MKIFTNKKIWQKIVLVMLILLLMQFFIGKPAHAIDGDVLLEPITSLFANLGDGIMNIMQQTIMGMDSSGAWVEKSDNSFWIKLAIIGAAIVLAVVAVVSIALSGGTAIVVITSPVGAVLKIAGGAIIAYFVVSVVHFGENGFFLPEYELTPQTIFKNEVLAFDVNFFNPQSNKIKRNASTKKELSSNNVGGVTDSNTSIYKTDVKDVFVSELSNKEGISVDKSKIEETSIGSESVLYDGYNHAIETDRKLFTSTRWYS